MYNQPVSDASLVACPHCDLLQHVPELAPGASARCPRCDEELRRHRPDPFGRTLAFAIAAAILYVVANTVPMLGLRAVGHQASTTVFGGVLQLWKDGFGLVALLVLLSAIVAPALQIGLMLAVVAGGSRRTPPRWVGPLLRHQPTATTWSMIEVMLLGVLVALIKIADYATVVPGIALFVLGALIFLLAAIQASFDPEVVWSRIAWAAGAAASEREASLRIPPGATAMEVGLQRCDVCELLSRPPGGADDGRCPRCDEALTFRKPGAVQQTWAFLVAAAICYVPANVLPVLVTSTVQGTESDTILQGVVLLWSPTGWPLSLIVLIASIMIPSAKLAALAYLLVTVQRGSLRNNRQRGRLYRIVEIIGRWSMVDVFVDTFTAALVQLPPLMSVAPGPGLPFFAAVVVLTMLAAASFDSRLIWDPVAATEVCHA